MSDSQKFLSRNRAPRVQIEYDVELYGASKKVQLPFVMGVMSDLSGKSEVEKGAVSDRKFLEIDIDNFDSRMKALKPRAAFSVPNTLTGEGNLAVDLVFEKMSDFSPAAIARKVEPLRKLLEARTQLSNLLAYMDGKAGAEALIEKLVANPEGLRALALGAGEGPDSEAIFAELKAAAPEAEDVPDQSDGILADMAATAPADEAQTDKVSDILSDMAKGAPEAQAEGSGAEDILATMAGAGLPEPDLPDQSAAVLAGLANDAPEEETVDSGVESLLADVADEFSETELAADQSDDILAALSSEAPQDDPETEGIEAVLSGIEALEDAPEDEGPADILAALPDEAGAPPEADLDDILADLEFDAPEEAPDDSTEILADLAGAAPEDEAVEDSGDILAELEFDAPDETEESSAEALADIVMEVPEDEAEADSADILAGLELEAPEVEAEDGSDDILAGLAMDEPEEDAPDDIDDILAGLEMDDSDGEDETGTDALLAEIGDADDDLDALLADMGGDDETDDDGADDDLLAGLAVDEPEDDLDALLAGLDSGADAPEDELFDLDALTDDDDLSSLLDGLEDDPDEAGLATPAAPKNSPFQPDFGSLSAATLQDEAGARRKFRIAVLGDFSGRGNRGDLEIGAALAKRKAFKLDFDTMEAVIQRFRTTLTLPLGNDGSAVEVELGELDDLHPDELFENVELFSELAGLRRDLKSGRNFEKNVERMQAWGGAFGDFRALSQKRSKGAEAPADLRLTDFQSLIGDSTPRPEASAASDLISRIIGPHIVSAPDNGAEAMIEAVDRALSTAMSSVLHHPDFQSVEAAWRSIELLGRRVETSAELEVVVYDISVEEFTADLAAQEDMAESGLFDMLVEKPRQDDSAGPISAVVGLYTWEETPTHAELLARMARISAHMDAPFISAISTGFMATKIEDRHKLVKDTWDALAEMPEAKYLGLASPRFMLRMPYGKKTEPLDRFDYEEFNLKEGMRSLLMANPALLVAVLLAETKAQQGGDMSLGSIMSLNDMPFHYMTDPYGDQVALPCTERLLSVSGAADVIARGFMPVISVQGQNMVKLGSFQAVGGGELLGIWAGDAAREMKSGKLQARTGVGISSKIKPEKPTATAAPAGGADAGDDLGLDMDDDLDLDMDLDIDTDDELDMDLDLDADDGDDLDDLDDLLAGFGDDDDDDDDDEMDADLAALLGDL